MLLGVEVEELRVVFGGFGAKMSLPGCGGAGVLSRWMEGRLVSTIYVLYKDIKTVWGKL